MNNPFLKLAAAAALALAFACGGEGDDDAPQPAPQQSIAVTGVALSQNALRLTGGDVRGLTAQVMPSDADNKGVTWSSGDDAVATVEVSGANATVTAHAPGTATITVRTTDGGHTDACTVTVTEGGVMVTGVTLDRAAMGLVPGSAGALEATIAPVGATNQDVSWASSSNAVATVAKGEGATAWVTAVANGTATITATTANGGFTATCAVTVAPYSVPIASMTLDRSSLDILTGRTRYLTAVILPPNAANQSVAWTTSNPAVAALTGTGASIGVRGVATGTATITATVGGMSASSTVRVQDGEMVLAPIPASLAGGFEHFAAIKDDGSLWAWGYNQFGQIGDGTTTNRSVPTRVGTDNDWVAVSCGHYHTVGIKSNGSLWAWGRNNYYQIGDGTTTTRTVPTRVGTGSDWVSVSAGLYHSVALRRDGSIWTWGYNANGQLGDGTTTNRSAPTRVGADRDWTLVAARSHSNFAISDGNLWAWGTNYAGQLGDGTETNRRTPVKVGTASDWAAVGLGYNHSLGFKEDGSLWAWGYNVFGQLGDGTATDRLFPIQLGMEKGWAAAAGGINHTLALRTDGSIWSWGGNGNYQLGGGQWDQDWVRYVPEQISADKDWVAVAASQVCSMAIRADGSLWAWGWNTYGQLGDGTTTPRPTPVQVGTGFRVPAK